MKKYTLNIIKTDKQTFMLETNKDLKLFEKVLKAAWGKEKFKKMREFYDSLSPNVDQALAKHFSNR